MPESPLAFNEAAETRRILSFIRRTVRRARARGVVVGLSGGIDSAVVGALCVKALGSGRVVAVQMPSKYTPAEDERDAEALVRKWGVRTVRVEISPLADELTSSLGGGPGKIANANVQARIRMTILYYVANSENLLVAGTGDRSEGLLGFFCYDEKTRIVTADGPKGIDELRVGDTVFSIDSKSKRIIEAPVQEVFRFNYDGEMIQHSSRSGDFLVTPNHRMLVQASSSRPTGRLFFRTARECLGFKTIITPLASGWSGTPGLPGAIEIPFSQRHIPRVISMDIKDAFYLFGLFVGDGCAVRGKATVPVQSPLTRAEYLQTYRSKEGRFVSVSSEARRSHMKTYDTFETDFALPYYSKSEARMKLVDLLDKYQIGHSYTKDLVRVPSKGIYELFVRFGIGARNKHIPRWVFEYPSEDLVFLLEGLMDSDGSHSDKANIYYTSSEELKDDFVQLCFRLGRRATVCSRSPRRPVIAGKIIRTGPSYQICFSRKSNPQHTLSNRFTRTVGYKGRVWCPSVSPHENMLVERNGKYMFSGNTKHGDGGVDFLPIAHLYKTQVRALGAHLGLPRNVVDKPASPQLWPGHTAAEELPADYDRLDLVLHCLFDEKLSTREAAAQAGMDLSVVHRVLEMHRRTAHKRALPPQIEAPKEGP
jgi:NH3-dependent NAD+ synthetase